MPAPQPVHVPGVVAPVTVEPSLFGRPKVAVGGVAVQHAGRNRYVLPGHGDPVEAVVRSSALNPFPTVDAGGQRFRTGPEVPLWLQLLAALPILLVAIGGLVGGVVAVGAIAANVAVVRSSMAVTGKALAVVGVAVAAAVVFVVLAAVLLGTFG